MTRSWEETHTVRGSWGSGGAAPLPRTCQEVAGGERALRRSWEPPGRLHRTGVEAAHKANGGFLYLVQNLPRLDSLMRMGFSTPAFKRIISKIFSFLDTFLFSFLINCNWKWCFEIQVVVCLKHIMKLIN